MSLIIRYPLGILIDTRFDTVNKMCMTWIVYKDNKDFAIKNLKTDLYALFSLIYNMLFFALSSKQSKLSNPFKSLIIISYSLIDLIGSGKM